MNTNNTFSAFKIMHRVMLFGQLLFLGILTYLVYSNVITPPLAGKDKALQVAAVSIAAIAFFAGNQVFKKRLAALKDSGNFNIRDRFEKYRAANILLWALLEAAALFSGLCLFLTGNYAFLALGGLLIIFFMSMAPDKNRTAVQSGLSIEEIESL